MNDVTDVLRDRMREPGGLERMTALSALLHAGVIVAALVVPGGWFSSREPELRSVMTISLGGSGGPAAGGMTPLGGRPVQQVTPPEAPRLPEPVRPPAQKAPEMTVPTPRARRAARGAEVKQAPDDARGRTPTRGEEVQAGTAVAETGARGQGFGLSTGAGGGAGVRLDVADFCCPDYLVQMIEKIRTNWDARTDVPGDVVMKFTILRDGTLSEIEVEEPSRFQALNINAQRALLATRRLDPLPAGFANPTLTVHLTFQYKR
jgi:TonB family protein